MVEEACRHLRDWTDEMRAIMFQQHTFTHHGMSFLIEADGWPDENSSRIAIGSLRKWTEKHDATETTRLYVELMRQSEAIVGEKDFDNEKGDLPNVRSAQKDAVTMGLGRRKSPAEKPTVCLQCDGIVGT